MHTYRHTDRHACIRTSCPSHYHSIINLSACGKISESCVLAAALETYKHCFSAARLLTSGAPRALTSLTCNCTNLIINLGANALSRKSQSLNSPDYTVKHLRSEFKHTCTFKGFRHTNAEKFRYGVLPTPMQNRYAWSHFCSWEPLEQFPRDAYVCVYGTPQSTPPS